jgi:hypothetical protein
MKLYEISDGLQRIDYLFEQDIIDDQAKSDAIDYLMQELKNKGNNLIVRYQDLKGDIQKNEDEQKRLDKVKKDLETKLERYEQFIKFALNKMGIDKVESALGTIMFTNSVTTEIIDEKKIPAKYLTVVPESYTFIKTDIKNAIKAGDIPTVEIKETKEGLEIISECARLVPHKNLKIK